MKSLALSLCPAPHKPITYGYCYFPPAYPSTHCLCLESKFSEPLIPSIISASLTAYPSAELCWPPSVKPEWCWLVASHSFICSVLFQLQVMGTCPSGSIRAVEHSGIVVSVLPDVCAGSSPGIPSREESAGDSCSVPDILETRTHPIQPSANFRPTCLLCFLGGSRERGVPEDFSFDILCWYIHNGLFVILYNKAVESPLCAGHLLGAWRMLFHLLEVMTHFLRKPRKACLWYIKTTTWSFLIVHLLYFISASKGVLELLQGRLMPTKWSGGSVTPYLFSGLCFCFIDLGGSQRAGGEGEVRKMTLFIVILCFHQIPRKWVTFGLCYNTSMCSLTQNQNLRVERILAINQIVHFSFESKKVYVCL